MCEILISKDGIVVMKMSAGQLHIFCTHRIEGGRIFPLTSAVQSYTDFCLLRMKRLLVLIEYDNQIVREESEITKCDI